MMPKGLMQFQLGIGKMNSKKTLDPASTSNFAVKYMWDGGE